MENACNSRSWLLLLAANAAARHGPVELDRVVPPSGNMWVAGRQFWIGPARAGTVIRFWADTQLIHLSAAGARLETDAPIPARTSITLESARYGSLGTASVRHCARHMLKYSIGVEFTSSLALAGQGRKRCLDEIAPPAESQS